jgi:hypothetical protein
MEGKFESRTSNFLKKNKKGMVEKKRGFLDGIRIG